MKWGGRIDFLQDLAKTGEEVPALINRPILTQWQRYFWEAFQTLSSSRGFHSAGVAAIPLSQIQAYFRVYDITDLDLKSLYVKHIQSLDNTYLEIVTKKT